METIGEEAITSKFQDLKADCFEFLCLYFEKQTGMMFFIFIFLFLFIFFIFIVNILFYHLDTLKNEDAFWDKLIPYCQSGVKDVANVRDNALWLLSLIQVERHDLAFPITKSMGAHLKARYDSDYRNQRPDFNRQKSNKGDTGDSKTNDEAKPTTAKKQSLDVDEKESKANPPMLNKHARKV